MFFRLLFCTIIISSCSHKYVPDSKLVFDKEYRSLFDAVTKVDRIEFYSPKRDSNINLIKVSHDSIIQNSKGYFTNQAPYKIVEAKYIFQKSMFDDTTKINISKSGITDENLFFIGGVTCWLLTDSLIKYRVDKIEINGQNFKIAYEFKMDVDGSEYCYIGDFISTVYLSPQNGMIAIVDKDGFYWYNINVFDL